MPKKYHILLLVILCAINNSFLSAQVNLQPNADSVRAQRDRMVRAATLAYQNKVFTKADTIRGSITPERAWWDVLRYDITIKPVFDSHFTVGNNLITYQVISNEQPSMQIDLQEPLKIDSIVLDNNERLKFSQQGNAWYVQTPKQSLFSIHTVRIYFQGKPQIAVRPPWDGGWTFTKDRSGHPWMTVCCQGHGASIWYPCKDHQSDEPDQGATLTMIAPSNLVAVSNGRKISEVKNQDGTTTTKWGVKSPISNYCIIPYIGDYTSFSEVFHGEAGPLDITYHVLKEDLQKAKDYMPFEVRHMLQSMEYWFGPYPFYQDGYQLVEVQHTGMEHQSAVAYGNWFAHGYRGKDLAANGWGSKWDFIIVHESGHEWFGNNITSKDVADMWVHESFTNYSETLYVEYRWGKKAGNEYNFGIRQNIRNDRPILGRFGVNESGSGDMYYKGSNMIHAIRHSLDNDSLFRSILRGLNKEFYHKTVTGKQIENYICKKAGFNYLPVFTQYLTTTEIPRLDLHFNQDSSILSFRWKNCIDSFNLPIALHEAKTNTAIKIYPSTQWQKIKVSKDQLPLFNPDSIKFNYYIQVDF
ncbi:Peptidase family M1 [Arachidicoccus rhizosphaerae]|uniref:Peptidase family M1 n=1 Tax=Arachidicoccus rhizosphaerae TaxID=551991 RepID=A0A1H3ZTH0_9BACT|nr:M1 family metallopeptidase [Arachidicoccus rhizosphaerae]SEA26915.1 Peptidase family M1 [Arachidicoccus rhizosphaerae]